MAMTDFALNKLKPRSSRYEVSDGKGLSVRITPKGTKTWVFRYMIDGIPRRMTLGQYPAVSLADVRAAHGRAMVAIEKGIDPGKKAQDEKAVRKAVPTISEFIDEFWQIELKGKKSGLETLRALKKDVIPVWRKRKVFDITRRDVVLLLDHVRERAPVLANRLQASLVRLFNFGIERGILENTPCSRLKRYEEKARRRVLSNDEIKLLWNALALDNKGTDIYRITKLALKMILITGQRPGEVCGMEWGEIQDRLWTIPSERMKNKESNSIFLTGLALDIFEQARPYSSDSRFVFRSSHNENEYVKPGSLSHALVRHWTEMGFDEKAERFTPHDLRRTVRTRLAESGVSDIIAERIMSHKLQGILAVYNRYDYDLEKRQALETWERELRRIVGLDTGTPGKVIPIRRAK
jgi:integrase